MLLFGSIKKNLPYMFFLNLHESSRKVSAHKHEILLVFLLTSWMGFNMIV
jgi:hypothetical protein